MPRFRRPSVRFLGLCASLAWVASCGGLPDYARPSGQLMQPGEYEVGDSIRYRSLSRDDFRALSPRNDIAEFADQLGAFTCANLVPGSFETSFSIAPEHGSYTAQLLGVEFHAEMDRDCSWWNPRSSGQGDDYILEHEQIHFAIVEMQARRLEAQVQALRARGDSPSAAAAALQRDLDEAMLRSLEVMLERNEDFDRDTSARYDPRVQARWFIELSTELEQSR